MALKHNTIKQQSGKYSREKSYERSSLHVRVSDDFRNQFYNELYELPNDVDVE